MGLDQYALITKETFEQPVDFTPIEYSEIHYWRKHPNLHGWMQALYIEKGGSDPEFNGATVQLTLADLNQLQAALLTDSLPETVGFFFGQSQEGQCPDDLNFVQSAKKAIEEGYTVYYDSWW